METVFICLFVFSPGHRLLVRDRLFQHLCQQLHGDNARPHDQQHPDSTVRQSICGDAFSATVYYMQPLQLKMENHLECEPANKIWHTRNRKTKPLSTLNTRYRRGIAQARKPNSTAASDGEHSSTVVCSCAAYLKALAEYNLPLTGEGGAGLSPSTKGALPTMQRTPGTQGRRLTKKR